MLLQFVEPINGSSSRSITTLSSYVLLYLVSNICTWGHARDDRSEVAPDNSLNLLNITERGESAGRWCEYRPWQAACHLATTAATLRRRREQTCALIRHKRPEDVRTEACLPPGRLLF